MRAECQAPSSVSFFHPGPWIWAGLVALKSVFLFTVWNSAHLLPSESAMDLRVKSSRTRRVYLNLSLLQHLASLNLCRLGFCVCLCACLFVLCQLKEYPTPPSVKQEQICVLPNILNLRGSRKSIPSYLSWMHEKFWGTDEHFIFES